jgi:hypothetical protein
MTPPKAKKQINETFCSTAIFNTLTLFISVQGPFQEKAGARVIFPLKGLRVFPAQLIQINPFNLNQETTDHHTG